MVGRPDELLRTVELGGRTYQIRHGDTRFQLETWWRIGRTVHGSQEWEASFGLYLPGKPVGHTTELNQHLAELRAEVDAQSITASRAKWDQR